MIRGFIINRFRGNAGLFKDGYRTIEEKTNWRGLGIVPWINAARSLPEEDAVRIKIAGANSGNAFEKEEKGVITIAVPLLPRISNHDDFDALIAEDSVRVTLVPPGQVLPGNARMIILPGSKATISDLEFFRAQGWDIDLAAHIRRGGKVLGICGGYQMLGKTIADPLALEGEKRTVAGLGLLPVHTVLTNDKRITDIEGFSLDGNAPFRGYEIHSGKTETEAGVTPLLRLSNGAFDGAVSKDGHVAGCYIHRLFDHGAQRAHWLSLLGAQSDGTDQDARVETALDALAASLKECLDIEGILEIAS
jgi:adenosylcobyric acid synthase